MRRVMSTFAVLLCFLTLPVLAAGDCKDPIRFLNAADGQTGAALRIDWSLALQAPPLSQTLSGSDFDEPVTLFPSQLVFQYVPEQPGEKHLTLTVVTDCGTFTREVTYHVQQCNVMQLPITLDKTTAVPGEVITASVDLPPGHRARWTVLGGTASAETGESIQITAGNPGNLRISVFVARGNENSNSCEVRTSAIVRVTQPCAINTPQFNPTSDPPLPSSWYRLYIGALGAGETVSFDVQNATLLGTGNEGGVPYVELTTPATGTFTIDVTVTKSGCSRTFSRTYEVTPCNPTATVTAVASTSCDSGTVRAEFTGTAPFQGYWSDGQYFFTSTNSIERTVTQAGTYTIWNFNDARCSGTVTGQAVVGAGLPTPHFAIDPSVNGWYYDNATCPGLARVANLTVPVPAGAEVVWSVENGTIVSGQGTSSLQFYGNAPGWTPVTVVFRNAQGCTSQPYTFQYLMTYGQPEVSVSVEPSTIGAGGTAIVTVTANQYTSGWNITSSLGDQIAGLGPLENGPGYRYEYRSSNGGGIATITVDANSPCGLTATASTTLTIDAGAPVQAKATVQALGSSCADYVAFAQFTGTAPFTGTWSNGEPFYSDWGYTYLYPTTGGTYTIASFTDANGPGTVTGEATFDFVALPQPDFSFSEYAVCPNSIFTATMTTPVPDGATITWTVWGGTIVSGQGTPTIEIQAGEFWTQATVQLSGPGACSPQAPWQSVNVSSYVQPVQFDVYPIAAGETTYFSVFADQMTSELHVENSMGDPVEIVSNPWPGYYYVKYTSTHGAGQSTIRVYGTTACGATFEATRVLTISAPLPTATLTSTADPLCGANVTVTFTGVAPFSGTWNDGTTFTTNEYSITRNFNWTQGVYLTSFSDATGAVNGSNWVWAEATFAPYAQLQMAEAPCVGKIGTARAAEPPPGYEVFWYFEGPQARIISGQGTTEIQYEVVEAGQVILGAKLRTATGCDGAGSGFILTFEACPTN